MNYWTIACVCVFVIVVLINPKTRLTGILLEQFKIYKNDKTNKYCFLDFLTFIIAPVLLAVLISQKVSLDIVVRHAETIITIFSLIATLPLSFLALFIDKMLKTQKEKEVAREAFVSITVDILYSMFLIATVIFGVFADLGLLGEKIVVGIVAFLTMKIALNILMILKRIFIIWEIIGWENSREDN